MNCRFSLISKDFKTHSVLSIHVQKNVLCLSVDGCAFSSEGEPGYFGDLHAGARWETLRACSYEMSSLESFVQTIIASSDNA